MAACDCSGVSGDPILAEDAYSNPKRVYLIGASRRVSYCDENHRADENQISVWSTVDGGSSWSNYAALDHQNDGTWVTDKPSIAVSSEPTTRGRVYAAHIRTRTGFDCGSASPTNRKIIVTRVDGMLTKEIDSLSPCASSPIMLVDSAHADWLYVVWIDWATNQINVLTSFDGFANFYRDEIAAGTFLGPAGADAIENGSGATINARSMLMARFNSITGTVGITWHVRETSENFLSSDVKFVEFTPYTRTFGTIRTVTDSQSSSNPGAPTSGAQWNPALDYDSNGDYAVSYCDTRGLVQSDSQFNYDVKTARIKPWGTRSGPVDRRLTPSASNLKLYDIPRNGEYMDIWHWNGKFYAGFIQIGAQGDAAVTSATFRQRTPVDFNGDHISDVVMYRQGTWICYNQNTGAQLWSVTTDNFTDGIPAPMDYDGDGRTEFSVFRPGIGWYFYNDNGTLLKSIPITFANAQPAPADYDGNGTDDVVVYHNGTWSKYDFNTGAAAWSITTDDFGDGIAVPMDYDGDGRAEFTVFRPGLNWHFYNEDGTHFSGIWIGLPGAVPAPGDYDGDGVEDAVVFNRDNPSWLFYNISPAAYVRSVVTPGGSVNGDPIQPAPLDYDGDGSVDMTYMNGGPWDFWLDDGNLRNAFWTGGNNGDLAMSRRQHTKRAP